MRFRVFAVAVLFATPAFADAGDIFEKINARRASIHVKEGEIVCKDKDDYVRFMRLSQDDESAASIFVKSHFRDGSCRNVDAGARLFIEKPSIQEPIGFHLKGDPTIYWVYIEGIEAR